MTGEPGIAVGRGEAPLYLLPALANRHGLITGATGTGKTVTLQVLAEGFSQVGVPVFVADAKGDLAGISQPAEATPRLLERAGSLGIEDWSPRGCPAVFWDVFGTQGHPLRATISDLGPLLLARLLDLTEAQEGALNIAFKVADDQGLLLLDLKDLRALLNYLGEDARRVSHEYGNVSIASIGAIQRALLVLEQQGGDHLLGEPALQLSDLMRSDFSGQGAVSILAADQLMQRPRLYATLLLWLLSELFEELPEIGDAPRPRLVFFFDEAHLLFDHAPRALVEKVEQVVRLIRSKGVGVYFVTQSPLDIPDAVLGQLGNRVQHALRAFTPSDQKAVRAAARTLRPNPALDVERTILDLAVGEALVSLLEANGTPSVVQRARIRPPRSRIGTITAAERQGTISNSPVRGRYDQAVDRESAYERLQARARAAVAAADAPDASPAKRKPAGTAGNRQSMAEALAKSVLRSLGSQIGGQLGRTILRGVLGSLTRSR